MKKLLLTIFTLGTFAMSTNAQSVMITSSLTKTPSSSALVQYNNLFGQWNMPDKDDPFPFAVIRIDLTGDENSVRAAKLKLGFDVGSLQRIESDVRTEPNKIIILVPKEVRNIYLTCGDGCEKQMLFSGHLESNTVYTCQLEYQLAASTPSSDGNDAVLQKLQELTQQLAQMQNQSATLPSAQQQPFQVTHGNGYDTYIVKNVSFDMVHIEGGTFMMGATNEQRGAYSNEKPAHMVTLSDYSIGKYEVTQELWEAVMGNNPSQSPGSLLGSLFGGSSTDCIGRTMPVECVRWDDCQTFVKKLNDIFSSQLGGKHFALPTEAQWEYAARGGNKSQGYLYSGGNNIFSVAWHYSNCKENLQVVGTKEPNELGLHDMSGNVSEWCQDCFDKYSEESVINPVNTTGKNRIIRGGGWNCIARDCRVAYRYSYPSSYISYYIGLRLALVD